MPQEVWQRRIARAEELGKKYAFAAEMLQFYAVLAKQQSRIFDGLQERPRENLFKGDRSLEDLSPVANEKFIEFLQILEEKAPAQVGQRAGELRNGPAEVREHLLNSYWDGTHPQKQEIEQFIARAFLQPYAEALRSHSQPQNSMHTPTQCPFCGRRPGLGTLRPLGEGGQRSLVCSFCLAEWPFRRIFCPGCGEEDYRKLPVYTAEEIEHVRVDACDSCKTYLKTVDLTRNGLAEPVVDEIAAIPLDLWAREQGYVKLQVNLMQM